MIAISLAGAPTPEAARVVLPESMMSEPMDPTNPVEPSPAPTTTTTLVDEGMEIVRRSRTVDKQKFNNLLQDVYTNRLTLQLEPGGEGVTPTQALAQYIGHSPEDQAKVLRWWGKYGKPAVEHVQQYRQNLPASVDDTITPQDPYHDFLTPVSDRVVQALEHERGMRREMKSVAAAMAAGHGIVENDPPPAPRHTFTKVDNLTDQFLKDCKANLDNPQFIVNTTIPRNYTPPFDRNDLLKTNRFPDHEQEMEIVMLTQGDTMVYLTWCLEGEQAQLLEGIRTGATSCNISVDNLADRHFQLEEIYPSQHYRPQDVFRLLYILEREIELRATYLRPPVGHNHVIHHASHAALYRTPTREAANNQIKTAVLERVLLQLVKQMYQAVRDLEEAIDGIPRIIRAFLMCETPRAKSCTAKLLGKLDKMKRNFERKIVVGVRAKAESIAHLRKDYQRQVEENIVEMVARPGEALTEEFHTLDNYDSEATRQAYTDLRLATDQFGEAYERAKEWAALDDVEWCRALILLELWDPESGDGPPHWTKLKKAKITSQFKKLSRRNHPDRNGDSDVQAKINEAKEYMANKK